MRTKELQGKAVVSLADASKLGYVDDLLFDTSDLRVVAFEMSMSGQRALLPFSEVRSIGKDAITVPSSQVAQVPNSGSPLLRLPRLANLTKLKVVDEDGTFVGNVTDLEIETRDGRISEVAAHRGGVLGLGGTSVHISASAIRSVGDEVIVVSSVVEAPDTPDTPDTRPNEGDGAPRPPRS
jgi:sporulation protein YlmC with PRC-barrel domain